MPSPFPGMNPYLEQDRVWHDFHERFIPLAAELIAAQVDPKYIVKIDEHIYIHELPAAATHFAGRADLGVARSRRPDVERGGTTTLAAPAKVRLPTVDIEHISYLQIRDRDDLRVITVLELLSPANKRSGPDREQYLAKRAQILGTDVHFVEIDLLRGGPRLPIEDLPDCDYYVLVSRVEARPDADLFHFHLRDPLPEIPIPLQAGDGDATLDLSAAIHRIYEAARYQTYIYTGQPQPKLTAEDETWARGLLSTIG